MKKSEPVFRNLSDGGDVARFLKEFDQIKNLKTM